MRISNRYQIGRYQRQVETYQFGIITRRGRGCFFHVGHGSNSVARGHTSIFSIYFQHIRS